MPTSASAVPCFTLARPKLPSGTTRADLVAYLSASSLPLFFLSCEGFDKDTYCRMVYIAADLHSNIALLFNCQILFGSGQSFFTNHPVVLYRPSFHQTVRHFATDTSLVQSTLFQEPNFANQAVKGTHGNFRLRQE
ncbi:hypothetical protein LY76DRAFT_258859 [Colletotrichum caudatum]|nr:hypothetical protein LY76DRAFT_258859 [Colletotrichum caudatum]